MENNNLTDTAIVPESEAGKQVIEANLENNGFDSYDFFPDSDF